MEEVLKWLSANWGWVVAFVGVFIEVTPIKVSPISALFKWIGKKTNQNINDHLDKLDKKFDEVDTKLAEQEKAIDMQRIANIRSLVLGFADELRRGGKASHENFLHVMDENATYEKLIVKYDIKNSVYVEAYKFICNKFHECMDTNSFLA